MMNNINGEFIIFLHAYKFYLLLDTFQNNSH